MLAIAGKSALGGGSWTAVRTLSTSASHFCRLSETSLRFANSILSAVPCGGEG